MAETEAAVTMAPEDPSPTTPVREEMRYCLLVVLISLAAFKVLMLIHEPDLESLVYANQGVVNGRPHWLAFQNRLLGPYVIQLLSLAGPSYAASLRLFILIMTLAQNMVMFSLLMKMRVRPAKATVLVAFFSFLFLSVQHFWFYSWDNIDLVLFTFFAYGILEKLPLPFFLLLFGIGIFNRESALFISFYLIFDAFQYRDSQQRWRFRLVSMTNLFIGIVLTVGGMAIVKLLRESMLNRRLPLSPDFFGQQTALGNHFPLLNNLYDLFYRNFSSTNILNSIIIIGPILYLLYHLRLFTDQQFKALLIYLLLVTNILMFGVLNESRMLIILLPFLIFFPVVLGRTAPETAPPAP